MANAHAPARVALLCPPPCKVAAEIPEATGSGFPWTGVSGSCHFVRRPGLGAASDDCEAGCGVDPDGLLEQAVEEQAAAARAATVEAEDELVEVEVELPLAHSSLMGAEQPALEQRRDAVDARHQHVRWVGRRHRCSRDVDEARVAEPEVARPAVRVDLRQRLAALADEIGQYRGAAVCDAGKSSSAAGALRARLDRDRDDRLAETAATGGAA